MSTPSQKEIGAPGASEEFITRRIRRYDSQQWCLEHLVPARTVDGKFYPHSWQRDGYYPRLEQAASRLLDDLMGEIPDTTSIEELIKAVEGARAEVIRIVREAVRELGKKGVH